VSRSDPAVDPADVADRLHSAAIHLLRRLRREDLSAGIGPARLSALSVLVFGGPRSLKRLAAAEQVRPPTMSRIVAGLERDGLVRREPDEQDGRRAHIHATAAGRRLLERARDRRVDQLAGWLGGLGAEERARVVEAVGILERMLAGAQRR
jgi:DNA-binding MarR family transcriptional regulator